MFGTFPSIRQVPDGRYHPPHRSDDDLNGTWLLGSLEGLFKEPDRAPALQPDDEEELEVEVATNSLWALEAELENARQQFTPPHIRISNIKIRIRYTQDIIRASTAAFEVVRSRLEDRNVGHQPVLNRWGDVRWKRDVPADGIVETPAQLHLRASQATTNRLWGLEVDLEGAREARPVDSDRVNALTNRIQETRAEADAAQAVFANRDTAEELRLRTQDSQAVSSLYLRLQGDLETDREQVDEAHVNALYNRIQEAQTQVDDAQQAFDLVDAAAAAPQHDMSLRTLHHRHTTVSLHPQDPFQAFTFNPGQRIQAIGSQHENTLPRIQEQLDRARQALEALDVLGAARATSSTPARPQSSGFFSDFSSSTDSNDPEPPRVRSRARAFVSRDEVDRWGRLPRFNLTLPPPRHHCIQETEVAKVRLQTLETELVRLLQILTANSPRKATLTNIIRETHAQIDSSLATIESALSIDTLATLPPRLSGSGSQSNGDSDSGTHVAAHSSNTQTLEQTPAPASPILNLNIPITFQLAAHYNPPEPSFYITSSHLEDLLETRIDHCIAAGDEENYLILVQLAERNHRLDCELATARHQGEATHQALQDTVTAESERLQARQEQPGFIRRTFSSWRPRRDEVGCMVGN
ncbi:hypothetical protein BJ878DRAFT_538833 [Calycina marina]|uniref:Uncharacterized protein n=1 Tax=Calycina marina TaxID=1763456 RepID=A0A9P7ZAK5_9HELO|nr:hypothetical protein BJ878DRAFT_538833 [Calycina marina]